MFMKVNTFIFIYLYTYTLILLLLITLNFFIYIKDGSNEWIFESLEDMGEISALDSKIFWWTLYIIPLIWTLLLVIGLLRLNFEYFPIMIAAISMNMANTVGYYKCSSR